MRRLISFLIVVAAVVLVVGFYRGWFLVDRERIHEDSQKAMEKVKETTDKILEPGSREAKEKGM